MDIGDLLEREEKRSREAGNKRSEDASQKPSSPVWSGPNGSGHNGGITFSLLSRYLCCKERFRLLVIEGLKPGEGFNHRLEYGNLWHVAEDAYSASRKDPTVSKAWKQSVQAAIDKYGQELYQKYPLSREEVEKWHAICSLQFPIYVAYWEKRRYKEHRVALMQEEVFDIPYKLPSGRIVRLKGKWDSVDLVGIGRNQWIELMENKTKGDIDEQQIVRQLTYDLQTMLYLVALQEWQKQDDYGHPIRFPQAVEPPVKGILYNVVRRPLSGGKGKIVRHKAKGAKPEEAKSDYYKRVAQYIVNEPETYFMRWQVGVTQEDIAKFRRECLDPILEQLCDWWEWISTDDPWREGNKVHSRAPYGIYNPLMEGNPTELDDYLHTRSTMGLRRTNNLFPELGEP